MRTVVKFKVRVQFALALVIGWAGRISTYRVRTKAGVENFYVLIDTNTIRTGIVIANPLHVQRGQLLNL
ncbi:hypothetical protein WA026_008597 [Henosepilachna vigintioctopunctata]|uniref:Uncharacterized protein n=1 Tax=Henosepilachna vigintioctopunctata TaxID=420089 RepID=A0AAW1UK16_9CUCU